MNIDEYANTVKLLFKLKGFSAIRLTILYEQLCNVRSTFKKFDIPLREIKGFGLSEHLYPTKHSRDIKDIDIWIPRSMLPNAHEALLNIDAKLIKPTSIEHYENIEVRYKDLYYTLGRGNLLELHMRLIPAKTKFSRYLDKVLASRNLTPEEEFIYLCVHGVLSGYYRLRWLTDLYLFLLKKS